VTRRVRQPRRWHSRLPIFAYLHVCANPRHRLGFHHNPGAAGVPYPLHTPRHAFTLPRRRLGLWTVGDARCGILTRHAEHAVTTSACQHGVGGDRSGGTPPHNARRCVGERAVMSRSPRVQNSLACRHLDFPLDVRYRSFATNECCDADRAGLNSVCRAFHHSHLGARSPVDRGERVCARNCWFSQRGAPAVRYCPPHPTADYTRAYAHAHTPTRTRQHAAPLITTTSSVDIPWPAYRSLFPPARCSTDVPTRHYPRTLWAVL